MWTTRTLVALMVGGALGLVVLVSGIALVLEAYVPPADILGSGGPIPFFETIKPVPFGLADAGAVLVLAFAGALITGRIRRRW